MTEKKTVSFVYLKFSDIKFDSKEKLIEKNTF